MRKLYIWEKLYSDVDKVTMVAYVSLKVCNQLWFFGGALPLIIMFMYESLIPYLDDKSRWFFDHEVSNNVWIIAIVS